MLEGVSVDIGQSGPVPAMCGRTGDGQRARCCHAVEADTL